jgi:hypothetical protein
MLYQIASKEYLRFVKVFFVAMRPSSRHGNGVFAVVDLPQGSVPMSYEGRYAKENEEPTNEDYSYTLGDLIGLRPPTGPTRIAQFVNDAAMIDLKPLEDALEADPDIGGDADKYEIHAFHGILDACIAYSQTALQCNCMDQAQSLASQQKDGLWTKVPFMIVENVEAGDELLFHYGCEYWLSLSTLTCSDRFLPILNRFLMTLALVKHDHEYEFYQAYKRLSRDRRIYRFLAPFAEVKHCCLAIRYLPYAKTTFQKTNLSLRGHRPIIPSGIPKRPCKDMLYKSIVDAWHQTSGDFEFRKQPVKGPLSMNEKQTEDGTGKAKGKDDKQPFVAAATSSSSPSAAITS